MTTSVAHERHVASGTRSLYCQWCGTWPPVDMPTEAMRRIGVVVDAGGGEVRVLVDRGLDSYPAVGLGVFIERQAHPDAGNVEANHFTWFMPDSPLNVHVDAYLDDFEAKMTEALTDPFVHDMAQSVLPLIAAYRLARLDHAR